MCCFFTKDGSDEPDSEPDDDVSWNDPIFLQGCCSKPLSLLGVEGFKLLTPQTNYSLMLGKEASQHLGPDFVVPKWYP